MRKGEEEEEEEEEGRATLKIRPDQNRASMKGKQD